MCVPSQGWKDVPLPEKQRRYHRCVRRHARTVSSAGWAGAAMAGVCLGLKLDEAESDASMGHQWCILRGQARAAEAPDLESMMPADDVRAEGQLWLRSTSSTIIANDCEYTLRSGGTYKLTTSPFHSRWACMLNNCNS